MLAVPVLAGSTSYALSEARGKKEGLDLKPRQGRYFYGVITGAMLIGLCLNLLGINPIHFLVFYRHGRLRRGPVRLLPVRLTSRGCRSRPGSGTTAR